MKEEQDAPITLARVRDIATRYLIAVACRKKFVQNFSDTLPPDAAEEEKGEIRKIEEEFESVLEELEGPELLERLEGLSDISRFEEARKTIKLTLESSPYEVLRKNVLKNCNDILHRLEPSSKINAEKILEEYPFSQAGSRMDGGVSRNDFLTAYICLTRMFLQAHEDLLDRLASTVLLYQSIKK